MPQLETSVFVSRQRPAQASGDAAGHAAAQAKPSVVGAQTGVPPAHCVPHAPQSVAVVPSVSQPFVPLASQSSRPAAQRSTSHAPDAQLASGLAHGTPQPPQSVAVRIDRSQPLVGRPSQSCQPSSHAARTQALASHRIDA